MNHFPPLGLKHRDERLVGASSEVKTSASPFVDMDDEEDPQVLYDKVHMHTHTQERDFATCYTVQQIPDNTEMLGWDW